MRWKQVNVIIKRTQRPIAALLVCLLLVSRLSTADQIDVYGTFHTLDIITDIAAAEDGDLCGNGAVNAVDLGLLRTGFFAPPGPGLGACSQFVAKPLR